MNILFVKKLFSPIGGSEAMTYQLATRLVARGHRVRVLCLWPRDQRYGFPPPAEQTLTGPGYRAFLHRGVEILQIRPHLRLLGQTLDVLPPFSLVHREVAYELSRGFEVVHNVCREYAADALAIARSRGVAFVSTPLTHPGQAWGGASEFDLRIYRQADAVVGLTEAERHWYITRGVAPERTASIGLGPTIEAPGDGDAFRRKYDLKGRVVLFVGRKERYKGIHAIVAAAPAVWREHPDTQFVFVGEPSALNFLIDPFRGRHDARLVDLPGMDEAEKPGAFAACDVFCLPSIHETFGLVFAEAWLCAKPVIGGDIPALREVIADGVDGYVVPQRPEAIARAIVRLLDNPALCRQMGAAGREKVRTRYNWERCVSEHEALYAGLVGSERGKASRDAAPPSGALALDGDLDADAGSLPRP